MKLSLQEYYIALRNNLSERAKFYLKYEQLERATDVLAHLNDKKRILHIRNCGRKTVDEINEMVGKLKDYVISLNETNENEVEKTQNDHSIQEPYDRLTKNLSTRTFNILKTQGLLQWENFIPYIKATEQDFLQFKNCGKKSAQELLTLASELQNILYEYSINYNKASLNEKNENKIKPFVCQNKKYCKN